MLQVAETAGIQALKHRFAVDLYFGDGTEKGQMTNESKAVGLISHIINKEGSIPFSHTTDV